MPSGVDVFVSYTQTDRAWAEWIAWQLESAGLTTRLQAWDFTAGQDWAHEIQRATTTARRTVAVLSADYLKSAYSEAEWRVAYTLDPSGAEQRLVPVRVEDVEPTGLLRTRIFVDLVGLDADTASDRLLAALRPAGGRLKPRSAPVFPGARSPAPRFPGSNAEPAAPRAPARRGSGRIWLATVGTIVAFATAMFTLRDSPSAPHAGRATPTPSPESSPTVQAPPRSAPASQAGGGAAAARAASGTKHSITAVCRQLSRDDVLRVADIRRLRARLREAGTGYDQTEALRGVLNRMKENSLGALAEFDAATFEGARGEVHASVHLAWNHGVGVVRTFADDLGSATTYAHVVAATRQYADKQDDLDDDWRRVSTGLQQLGGAGCRSRSRESAPSVRLHGPAAAAGASAAALSRFQLDVSYSTSVVIGSPVDILDPSTGKLPRKSALSSGSAPGGTSSGGFPRSGRMPVPTPTVFPGGLSGGGEG